MGHSRMSVDERRAAEERENEENNSNSNANATTADPLKEDSDSKGYNYLLGQQLWSLTRERKQKLEKEMKEKQDELEKTKNTTKEQFWLNDLEKFEQSYDANEVQIKKLKEEALTKINKKINKKSKMDFSRAKKSVDVGKDKLPAEDGIRIEPKFEAPRIKRESGEKKERVKKEKNDPGAGSKKITDYGLTTKSSTTKKITAKTEKMSLEDHNDDDDENSRSATPIDKAALKKQLDSKPKKSALKKDAPLSPEISINDLLKNERRWIGKLVVRKKRVSKRWS